MQSLQVGHLLNHHRWTYYIFSSKTNNYKFLAIVSHPIQRKIPCGWDAIIYYFVKNYYHIKDLKLECRRVTGNKKSTIGGLRLGTLFMVLVTLHGDIPIAYGYYSYMVPHYC